MADKIDEANNFDNRKVIVHARNYCFELANKLNYKYFIQLDDDYYEFIYKFSDTKGQVLAKDINKVFDLMFNFYKKTRMFCLWHAQTT